MRTLAYCTFFPEPDNHGDAIRRGMILRALRQTCDLTIVAVRRPSTTTDDESRFRQQFPEAEIHIFDPDFSASKTPGQRARRVMSGIRRLVPAWVMSQHSEQAVAKIHSLAQEHDAVLLVGEPSGLAARGLDHARVIWDKSNVLTASLRSAIRGPRSFFERWHARANLPLARRFERKVIDACSDIWVTSEEENRRLCEEFKFDADVSVIPSAVAGSPRSVTLDANGPFVWMSSLSYTDNWIGLIELLQTIVDEGIDTLRVRVIGGGSSAAQRKELARFSFVDFYGFAEDLSASLQGARAGIVPVWTGAGVKLKTLTLINFGIPIIATECALEGIPAEAAYAVPTSAKDFVSVMVGYDSLKSETIAKNAQQIVDANLSSTAFEYRVTDAICRGDES